jgi:hypothetical protein
LIGGKVVLPQVFLPVFTLQRSKQELFFPVSFYTELNGAIAQVTNPIKKNNVF